MIKSAEELKIGDIVNCIVSQQKYGMITDIKPYNGPLSYLGCFGIVETTPGVGFSLFHGQTWEVIHYGSS